MRKPGLLTDRAAIAVRYHYAMTPRVSALPQIARRAILRLPVAGLPLVGGARGLSVLGLPLLGACTPRLNWRDTRSPGGEVRMQLPARPASMTRSIHLRNEEIEMTMIGAEVDALAFTVAIARGAPGESAEDLARHLGDMREQMLRNIAAASGAPTRDQPRAIPVIDDSGRARGQREGNFVDAQGSGPHDAVRLQGLFFVTRQLAAQAVVIGRSFDDLAASHFFDSVRIVES